MVAAGRLHQTRINTRSAHAQVIGQRRHACRTVRAKIDVEVGREVACGIGAQKALIHRQDRQRASGVDGGRVVRESQGVERGRNKAAGLQLEGADVEGCVQFCVNVSDVVNQHPVVVGSGVVFDDVAGDHPENLHSAVTQKIDHQTALRTVGREGIGLLHHILAHLDVGDDGNGVNGNPSVVAVTQAGDEGCACLARVRVVIGADHQRDPFRGLELNNGKAGRMGTKEGGEVDVGRHVRLVLIQVGDCVIGIGALDEGEVHAFVRVNHLVVGADGCHAAALAGVDGVTVRDLPGCGRVLAGDDDRHLVHTGAAITEHQEQVLTRGRTFQGKVDQGVGRDVQHVLQNDDFIGLGRVWVLDRLILHQPDFGAGGARIACGSCSRVQVGSENDGAASGFPEDNVVVKGRNIQVDSFATAGLEAAVRPIATRDAEAHINDAGVETHQSGAGWVGAGGTAHGRTERGAATNSLE